MGHVIELARSGRAKCRGCGRALAKGEARLGETLPNPYADDGHMTLWFHPQCAAYKRPEVMLEALAEQEALAGPDAKPSEGEEPPVAVPDPARMRADAELGQLHRRLPRLDGASIAPSGRARCRQCKELIAKGSVRVSIVFYEEGRFDPGGHIHLACAPDYFETRALRERILHFSPDLPEEACKALDDALG